MARYEFRLPDIGEGVHEGEIVELHVSVGDVVHEHDPMVDVMTDKTTVAIGAPKDGRIVELRASVGETVKVGAVVVVMDVGAAEPAIAHAASTPAAKADSPVDAAPVAAPVSVVPPRGPAVASAVGDLRDELPGSRYFASTSRPADDYRNDKPLATPATRALAKEMEVDLTRVRPTGPEGRVTDEDVRAHHEHFGHPLPKAAGRPGDRRVPFVGLRRKIAERMQRAVNTAAHFTFVEECDAGPLLALRESLRPFAKERGIELSLLPFVVKAVVSALEKHPVLNSALDEDANEIVYRSEQHIGIATATERGLVVPVIRDAEKKSILGLAREIERLSRAAREDRIKPSELSGSTFTITSLGKQGGLLATPVLNLPEVGILGVHQIKKKPVVKGDSIVIGDVMLLSLTCDHRLVDGHVGAAFAYSVIEALEHPERMLAEGLEGGG